MIPSVVPIPSSRTSPVLIVFGVRLRPAVAMNSRPTAITTTLLTTGVHIGAAKCPRAFSIAPASELTP